MHMMLRNVFDLHRAEGTESDMKSDLCNIYSHRTDFFQQFRCKMKPGGRCRCGTFIFCVDGLVTVFIFEFMRVYGGSGIWPSWSRISSKTPSYVN